MYLLLNIRRSVPSEAWDGNRDKRGGDSGEESGGESGRFRGEGMLLRSDTLLTDPNFSFSLISFVRPRTCSSHENLSINSTAAFLLTETLMIGG